MCAINPDILLLFSGRPTELELCLALEARILSAFPDVHIRVSKTQVGFANRYLFAFASLPVRRKKGWPDNCLVVSFGLGHRLDCPRIAVATEPYPHRWTHHVLVAHTAQIDDELLEWIGQAYAFSAAKR